MQEDTAGRLRQVLKTERVRRRLSQADAAAMAGRTRKWLSEYERGLIDPSAGTLFRLAEGLGVKIDVFVAEDLQVKV